MKKNNLPMGPPPPPGKKGQGMCTYMQRKNKAYEVNMLILSLEKHHEEIAILLTYERCSQIDKRIKKVVHTNSCDVDFTEGFMFRFLSKYISCYWVKLGCMQTASCTMGSNHLR